ncbi:hypothetical protein JNW88_24905 [Micromonospora sp. ATA32]|nr:hypothetical protein [Micromonospora sp. ATA32]
MNRGPCTVLGQSVGSVRGHLRHLSLPLRLIVNLSGYTKMSVYGYHTEKDSHHPHTKDHAEKITVDVASPSRARLPLMPSGGARASIDLSSSAIAATVSRQGARVPILIDGRLVMPPGVAIGPAGQLYAGLDTTPRGPSRRTTGSSTIQPTYSASPPTRPVRHNPTPWIWSLPSCGMSLTMPPTRSASRSLSSP